MEDAFRELAASYALGVLDRPELEHFERHLASGCAPCRTSVDLQRRLAAELGRGVTPVAPAASLKEQVLDLAEAPSLPVRLDDYAWDEVVPGVRAHVVREDPGRGVRGCLVWARPGARMALHRHLGDENILVLQGRLRDERGTYGPGEVCRSRTGSVHSEEAMPGDDCICYVVYYGGHEPIEA
jgi:quercetin dioxygenase-like cupin family protein